MLRNLPVVLLGAVATAVHAQPAEAPMETASPFAIWAFALLFFGACGVYGWMTWRNSKKDQAE